MKLNVDKPWRHAIIGPLVLATVIDGQWPESYRIDVLSSWKIILGILEIGRGEAVQQQQIL